METGQRHTHTPLYKLRNIILITMCCMCITGCLWLGEGEAFLNRSKSMLRNRTMFWFEQWEKHKGKKNIIWFVGDTGHTTLNSILFLIFYFPDLQIRNVVAAKFFFFTNIDSAPLLNIQYDATGSNIQTNYSQSKMRITNNIHKKKILFETLSRMWNIIDNK